MKAKSSKSASAQAGEFVRAEIEKVRAGMHGVRSTKQAIAIGLSQARRAGVKLPIPAKGKVSDATRRKAQQDAKAGARRGKKRVSAKRSRATLQALRRESTEPVSPTALSRHARAVARRRSPSERSASAKKAARTRRQTR